MDERPSPAVMSKWLRAMNKWLWDAENLCLSYSLWEVARALYCARQAVLREINREAKRKASTRAKGRPQCSQDAQDCAGRTNGCENDVRDHKCERSLK